MHDPWFPFAESSSQTRVRLFCLPPAGGGARLFLPWQQLLPSHVAVYAVELPGRAARLAEAPFTSVLPLVKALSPAVLRHRHEPYALFGHSMGGLVAFELARRLRGLGAPAPAHLFVSGARAPHLPDRDWCHLLPDAELIVELRKIGGFPDEVLKSTELMQVLLPTIRADAEITERYAHIAGPALDCPLTALSGDSDEIVPRDQVEAWRDYTRGQFTLAACPGGHDFLSTSAARVVEILSEALSSPAAQPQRDAERRDVARSAALPRQPTSTGNTSHRR